MEFLKTRALNIGFLITVGVLFMAVVASSVLLSVLAYTLLGLLLIYEYLN